ncbi:hypothetical protein G6F35_010269 [Rhizopus arrhizus]|nr:hypothetical protein G6F35_010269 [Rhizopus arrhizus]
MCSTVSACLATAYQIKGVSYSLSAACATSAHCIGAAADMIRHGAQDIMFAGGGEDLHWSMSVMFDAMGALSTSFNETPASASRPYDKDRDGFVIAGGGGMLVLEDYDHAVARGAHIHAELIGYGVTSDGADMVAPSGEGAVRCMKMALQGIDRPLDYLNTHGTSTPLGDVTELNAIREVFGDAVPPLSSTKALSGHSLGAASVHEAIYCLLMMRDGFVAGSANIAELDPKVESFPILRESREQRLDTVMSNSFGFGGTNAALVFGRVGIHQSGEVCQPRLAPTVTLAEAAAAVRARPPASRRCDGRARAVLRPGAPGPAPGSRSCRPPMRRAYRPVSPPAPGSAPAPGPAAVQPTGRYPAPASVAPRRHW